MMDSPQSLMDEETGNVKIVAESDSVFFGLNNIMATSPATALFNNGNGIMDHRERLSNSESFLATEISDLDFDLLQDLPLSTDFNLLDDILMNDDSSNSFSSESYVLDSVTDSPPLTPPSPSGSNSSLSQFEVKLEPVSYLNGVLQIDLTNNNAQLKSNIPKSTRGRSASHEAPELQALKRHIRMIRNRESACMSRKKKKDYVTGVENRVKELEVENLQLKHENSILKRKLLEVGHFIKTPSSILSSAASAITSQPNLFGNSRTKSNKPNTNLPAAAAKIALLSLCCFLFVSLRSTTNQYTTDPSLPITNSSRTLSKIMTNSDVIVPRPFLSPAGSTSSFKSKNNLEHDVPPPPTFIRGRRSNGLWESIRVDDSFTDRNESYNSTKDTNSSQSHRHLSKHVSRSNTNLGNENSEKHYQNETLANLENCALLFNQTEALRVQNHLKGIFGKRSDRIRKKPIPKPIVYSMIDLQTKGNENKGLTVYDEKMRRYSKVFDQLERRDDTYYVVSLTIENQILFSAKAHNMTSRPKMTFLMPWRNETHGGKEELMQIDCEVTGVFTLNRPNTKE